MRVLKKGEHWKISLFDNSLFHLWEVELCDFCSAWLRCMFKKKNWCICSLETTEICLGSPPAHSFTHSFHPHVLGASCTSGPRYRASCHALRHARTWHSWHLTAVELPVSNEVGAELEPGRYGEGNDSCCSHSTTYSADTLFSGRNQRPSPQKSSSP